MTTKTVPVFQVMICARMSVRRGGPVARNCSCKELAGAQHQLRDAAEQQHVERCPMLNRGVANHAGHADNRSQSDPQQCDPDKGPQHLSWASTLGVERTWATRCGAGAVLRGISHGVVGTSLSFSGEGFCRTSVTSLIQSRARLRQPRRATTLPLQLTRPGRRT